MKILLLGKTGQLGEELYLQGKKRKLNIKGYAHKELDIVNFPKLKKILKLNKPDCVINATAFHVVSECETRPQDAFLINSIAVKNLAEVCFEINSKFVTFSTDYVFDGKKGSPYTEKDAPHPVQTYGVSKLAGEHLALAFNPETIIIRTCGVYGGKSGSRSKKGNFILNMLKEKEKDTLEVSSEQIVSPTYAEDLANATYQLISKKGIGGIYHLINEGYCSWAELAQEIMKTSGSTTKIIPVDRSGQSGGSQRPLFSALKNVRAANMGIKLPKWKDAVGRYVGSL